MKIRQFNDFSYEKALSSILYGDSHLKTLSIVYWAIQSMVRWKKDP